MHVRSCFELLAIRPSSKLTKEIDETQLDPAAICGTSDGGGSALVYSAAALPKIQKVRLGSTFTGRLLFNLWWAVCGIWLDRNVGA